MPETRNVVVMVIGDTGTGKSSFGNLYLGEKRFEASDSALPVTIETSCQSNIFMNVKRTVIDTQGLEDGQSVLAEQLQNMGSFLHSWENGINAIVVTLKGQCARFSQNTKNIIQLAYNVFGFKEVLNHICVVFTHCFEVLPNIPDRNKVKTEYGQLIKKHLEKVSGYSDFEIPIFFVDTESPNSNETSTSIAQFNGWVISKSQLDSNQFKEDTQLCERIEPQEEKHVFVEYEYTGENKENRFSVFIDRRRNKIIPNNRDPPRYSEWEEIKRYNEPAGTKAETI